MGHRSSSLPIEAWRKPLAAGAAGLALYSGPCLADGANKASGSEFHPWKAHHEEIQSPWTSRFSMNLSL